MKENKARWYSIIYVICLGLLISSLPFSMFINDEHIIFILESISKIIAIIVVLYYIKKDNIRKFEIGESRKKDLLFIPLLFLCFSNYFVMIECSNVILNDIPIYKIIYGIGNCLFTAVLEELLFRFILLNEFLDTKKKIIAIGLSSIVFGLVHLLRIGSLASIIPALVQVAYTSFLGLFLGIIYTCSKNLIYPILFHFCFNFINGFLIDNLFKLETSINYFIINILVGLITLSYAVFIYYLFNKEDFKHVTKNMDI